MLETDPEVLAAFSEEATERLAALEAGLLELERAQAAPSPDLLGAVFRDAHSIKAGANLLRMRDIETAAHLLENVLDCLRRGQLAPGEGVIGPLLDGVDLLRELLDKPEAPPPQDMPRRLAVLSALADRPQEAL